MERDRSLEEFLGGESDDGDGRDDADGSDDAEDGGEVDRTGDGAETDLAGDDSEVAADDATERETEADATTLDPDAVEPATVTYQWTPAGASCDRCGARVERRWRDDGAYVCEDCKEW